MADSADEALLGISEHYGSGIACQMALLPLALLLRHVTRYLRAADYLDGLARLELWIRIEGELQGPPMKSGPGRLAAGRNPPRLMIDLCFTKSEYEHVSREAFRQLFVGRVEECFELMLARALKSKAVKDETRTRFDFANVMGKFRTEPIPPFVPLGTPQVL